MCTSSVSTVFDSSWKNGILSVVDHVHKHQASMKANDGDDTIMLGWGH